MCWRMISTTWCVQHNMDLWIKVLDDFFERDGRDQSFVILTVMYTICILFGCVFWL